MNVVTRLIIGLLMVAVGLVATTRDAVAVCDPADCNGLGQCESCDGNGNGNGNGNGGGGGGAKTPDCMDVARRGGKVLPPDDAKPGDWVEIPCIEGGITITMWVERGDVDPEQIAWMLISRVQLRPIAIGLTPKGPDPIALVGLPVWLWVDDPSRTTWGPATISAGGVTLTAEVESVKWSLGDGATISCGKGTVWEPGTGVKSSPTCGHTYTKQGTYTVTATTHWVARWSGYGQSGEIPFDLTASRQLSVGEIQVLGTNR